MTADPTLSPALAPILLRPCTIIAVTDDGADERFAPIRDAAGRLAAAPGGHVVLYHQPGPLDTPRGSPRIYVPSGGRQHTGSRCRDLLRDEAGDVRAHGIDVAVWLPPDRSTASLADAVACLQADLVLLPAARTSSSSVDRTLEHRAARIPVPVVAVDREGRLAVVRPLTGSRPALVSAAFDARVAAVVAAAMHGAAATPWLLSRSPGQPRP